MSPQNVQWALGTWVTRRVSQIIEGQSVRCQLQDMDRYGRTVTTCALGGRDLGRELVSAGLAFAYRRYSMKYDLDEKAAAVRVAGLHAHQVQ